VRRCLHTWFSCSRCSRCCTTSSSICGLCWLFLAIVDFLQLLLDQLVICNITLLLGFKNNSKIFLKIFISTVPHCEHGISECSVIWISIVHGSREHWSKKTVVILLLVLLILRASWIRVGIVVIVVKSSKSSIKGWWLVSKLLNFWHLWGLILLTNRGLGCYHSASCTNSLRNPIRARFKTGDRIWWISNHIKICLIQALWIIHRQLTGLVKTLSRRLIWFDRCIHWLLSRWRISRSLSPWVWIGACWLRLIWCWWLYGISWRIWWHLSISPFVLILSGWLWWHLPTSVLIRNSRRLILSMHLNTSVWSRIWNWLLRLILWWKILRNWLIWFWHLASHLCIVVHSSNCKTNSHSCSCSNTYSLSNWYFVGLVHSNWRVSDGIKRRDVWDLSFVSILVIRSNYRSIQSRVCRDNVSLSIVHHTK